MGVFQSKVKKQGKGFFEPVEAKPGFARLERERLKYWYEAGVVKGYLRKNRKAGKRFSFLDGPITANNPMGVHHAWGRTYKDLWQRYFNMRGYRQRFQNGFDCQGLWVEVEVEKELGLRSKKEIENLVPGDKKASIARFVELCRQRVQKYVAIQTEQSKRLGYFMDWEHSYHTMSDENNYMIWGFLKKCHQEGLIYKGRDSVPWCPRCGTAISQHEILTEDYQEVTHESIYLELPVVGKEREFLLIWTTTPWTIPANVAVAVSKKLDYSLVEGDSGDFFWVAKDLVSKVFEDGYRRTIKTVKGSKLVGWKYRGPFDNLEVVARVAKEQSDKFHRVVASDEQILPVTTGEGTGLIHVATGAGTEDFRLGKKYGLPVLPVIEEDARYLPGWGWLSGKNAKDNPRLILDYLEKEDRREGVDWVFEIADYSHRYPACWRCKKELVWRVVDEWYIAMDGLSKQKSRKTKRQKFSPRERMKKVTKKIRWIPAFGLKRELDWLNNMEDWLISKKRYWGLALPIWECGQCGSFEVVGSKEELQEKAVEGWKEFEGHTPHRPDVDAVKIRCECGGLMERVPDVGNPWLDAGIVAFSTVAENNQGEPLYKKNRQEWEKWFPADFITESFPGQFKNWFYSLIAQSTILEDREPFKTVLGFGTLLAEDGRPMHKSWGNAIEFGEGAEKIGVDVMRWMYCLQDPAANLLFGYRRADLVRRQFHLLLWNVYKFFVVYANIDKWRGREPHFCRGDDGQVPVGGQNVLDRWILSRLEQVRRAVTKALDNYNAKAAAESLQDFVSDLSTWYVRRSRGRVGPMAENGEDKQLCYRTLHEVLVSLSKLLAPFVPFLADEIYTNLTGEQSVHLVDWPETGGEVDGELLGKMVRVRQIVEQGHAARKLVKIGVRQPLGKMVVKTVAGKPLGGEFEELIKDELNLKEVEWVKGKIASGVVEVKLDTQVTPSLEAEGAARKLARRIQLARKEAGCALDEQVEVVLPEWPEGFGDWIEKRTLARLVKGGGFELRR